MSPQRTLDALRLATLVLLRSRGSAPVWAACVQGMAAVAVGGSFALAVC